MTRLAAAWARWRQFWFAPAPLVDLAIARVLLCAIVLRLHGDVRVLAVGLVSAEHWKPLPWIEALGFSRPPMVPELVWWGRATRIALASAALGFATNVSLLAVLVLQLVQEAFLNCFGKTSHGTIPLLYALLFFALSPCGRVLSLDAALRRAWCRVRNVPAQSVSCSVYARWPFDLLFVELAAYYFLAGVAKLRESGLLWADGATLQYYLLEKATPAGLWLAGHVRLCSALSVLVLVFELSWPLGVVLRRLRPALLVAGLGFYWGTIVFLRISFWPVWSLYLLLVPWRRSRAAGGDGRNPTAARDKWWPTIPNKETIIREGFIKAVELAILASGIPVVSYWVVGVSTFEVMVAKSEVQVTVFLLTPPPRRTCR